MNERQEPSAAVIALLREGRKIDAIKLVREEADLDLRQAKEFVEDFVRQHPERFPSIKRSSNANRYIIYALVVLAFLLTYEFVN